MGEKNVMRKILFILFLLCGTAHAETTWFPDTCDGCSVVYDVDPADPANKVIFKRINHVDPAHMTKTPKRQFDAILEENQRKNKAIKAIMDADPALVETDKDGNDVLKKDVKIDFSYDAERVLRLEVKQEQKAKGGKVTDLVTPEIKTEYQTVVSAELGENKVEIQ